MNDLMTSRRFFLPILLIACAISAGSIWKIFVEKSEYRFFYRGDTNGELNAYTGGLNFVRHGFVKLCFLPGIQRYEESADALMKQRLYTHYPPGPDLMSGAMQAVGIHGFYQQKACILSVNLIAMLLLALAIRRLLPDEQAVAPMILAALVITSAWFIWWAGNLHKFAYEDCAMALGVWAVAVRKEKFFLLACFMGMSFSFEPVPWLAVLGVFLAGQRVAAKLWNPRQALAFLAAMMAAFLLSFGIHLFQNVCYFGSFSAALNDLLASYQLRIGETNSDDVATSYNVLRHIVKGVYASLWFYGTGALILAVLGLRESVKRRLWLPLVLLCAGLVWAIAFRQHSMVHAFTWRHLGIGVFVLATIGFLSLWEQTRWKKGLALLLLFAALFRLPLGCQMSYNRLFLHQLRTAIAKTDSATIAELVYFLKDNPEHISGKQILIDELALRGHVLPDRPAYTIVMNGRPLTIVRSAGFFALVSQPAQGQDSALS